MCILFWRTTKNMVPSQNTKWIFFIKKEELSECVLWLKRWCFNTKTHIDCKQSQTKDEAKNFYTHPIRCPQFSVREICGKERTPNQKTKNVYQHIKQNVKHFPENHSSESNSVKQTRKQKVKNAQFILPSRSLSLFHFFFDFFILQNKLFYNLC